MAWETRRGKRYYYQAGKHGGKVKKKYVGSLTDAVAQVEADLDKLEWKRAEYQRQIDVLDIEQDEAERAVQRTRTRTVEGFAALCAQAAGYHRHKRGPWRKRRKGAAGMDQVNNEAAALIPATNEGRKAFILRVADTGKKADPLEKAAALQIMREYPDVLPLEVMNPFYIMLRALDQGDLTGQSIRNDAIRKRWALAGLNPSPLEMLLVDDVVACYLYLGKCQQEAGKAGLSTRKAAYQVSRLKKARQMYHASIKTLAEVRRLQLPAVNVAMPGAVQVNVGEKQVNLNGTVPHE